MRDWFKLTLNPKFRLSWPDRIHAWFWIRKMRKIMRKRWPERQVMVQWFVQSSAFGTSLMFVPDRADGEEEE